MAFKFRFEKLAQHRQRLIDKEGRAVALAGQVVGTVRTRIATLDQKIAVHQHQFLSRNGEAVDVAGLMSRSGWVLHLESLRAAAASELREANEVLVHCQVQLQAAWRDKEILEKLRLKQEAKWREEQAKRERQELDEIGQIRADRQRRARRVESKEQSAGKRQKLPSVAEFDGRNYVP